MSEAKIEGAVVLLYLKRRHKKDRRSPTLAGAELVNLGGRTFLAGSLMCSHGHWADGRRTYFALDEIESMIEFETIEAWKEMIASGGTKARRRWGI